MIIKEIILTDSSDSILPVHKNDKKIKNLAFKVLGHEVIMKSDRVIYQPSEDSTKYFVIKDRNGVSGWINSR